jgi:hypothetical protein
VIVVDNGSSDGTADWLAREQPQVRVIALPENRGVAAYNEGFAAAQGRFILVLDDDSWPAPEAVGRMLERFALHPRVGIAGFDIRHAETGTSEWRRSPALWRELATGRQDGVPWCEFIGCGAGIRREALELVGGYDPDFFLYTNEIELALRMLDLGYQVRIFPDLVAYHLATPVGRPPARRLYYETRNNLWLGWLRLEPGPALKHTARKVLALGVRALAARQPRAYLAGLWAAVRGWPRVRQRRHSVSEEVACFYFDRLPPLWSRRVKESP